MTSRGRVLIVEDHTMIAEYLASVLGSAGFEAIQAHCLAQARQRLTAPGFDLWLCDRHLPDGDSSDLLRQHPGHPPAIVLTADLDGAGRRALLACGFSEALAKPCPPGLLLACVARVLAGTGGPAGQAGAEPPLQVAEAPPILDDGRALARCGGDRATVDDLRALLAAELPRVRARIRAAAAGGDRDALGAELHRLAGAAGWVGAEQVNDCLCAAQSRIIDGGDPAPALARLDQALAALLRVLGQR
jgi:DNA-binding response OmpR family regulator